MGEGKRTEVALQKHKGNEGNLIAREKERENATWRSVRAAAFVDIIGFLYYCFFYGVISNAINLHIVLTVFGVGMLLIGAATTVMHIGFLIEYPTCCCVDIKDKNNIRGIEFISIVFDVLGQVLWVYLIKVNHHDTTEKYDSGFGIAEFVISLIEGIVKAGV